MNEKSLIAQFINHHPNDWKELLESKNIKIKYAPNDYRAIFNYGIECDFSDPIVQEARGIIINIDTLEVVCWPFRKFGNYGVFHRKISYRVVRNSAIMKKSYKALEYSSAFVYFVL